MSDEKLPLMQDPDYITSYADGLFLKLDRESNTVRMVFYKKEIALDDDNHTKLPEDLVKNLIFEVRMPTPALNGLLDIAWRFNKYREELVKTEEMSDDEILESFNRFTDKLASSTYDTSNPEEHDRELNAKFNYYLVKRQAKDDNGEEDNAQEQS